jgi:outer membrane protein
MNKGLLFLNSLLVVAVAVLFYLYFSEKNRATSTAGHQSSGRDTAAQSGTLRVAYFDMDSIEANFTLFKEMEKELMKREAGINDTINQMKTVFQNYYQQLQAQSAGLSKRQMDSLGNELGKMDMDIKNRAAEMNQGYQGFYMSKQQEIVNLIKKYCLEFNKDGKYTYIIANEPGLVYYKDTAYNVTGDLIRGLNEFYSKQKKN